MNIKSRTPIPQFRRSSQTKWCSGTKLECVAINDELANVRTYTFIDPVGGNFQLMSVVSEEQTVFCCGPAGFMTQVKRILSNNDFNLDRYHQESFGSPNTQTSIQTDTQTNIQTSIDNPLSNTEISDGAESVVVNFEEKDINAHQGQLLLDALRQNKVIIPTGCKNGICGTCRLKKSHGDVRMQHQDGLHKSEEDQGFILVCCSTLKSDLSLVRE